MISSELQKYREEIERPAHEFGLDLVFGKEHQRIKRWFSRSMDPQGLQARTGQCSGHRGDTGT